MKYELHDKGTDKLLAAVKAAGDHVPTSEYKAALLRQNQARAPRPDASVRNLKHST